MRDPLDEQWFGPHAAFADLPPATAERALRELGDETLANELAVSARTARPESFGAVEGFLDTLLNRITKTSTLCGVVRAGSKEIRPVSQTKPDPALRDKELKITLDGLHIAKYPGRGRHTILFDFAVQSQIDSKTNRTFHYNAKFQAHDGETVPCRNFPLFYGVKPKDEGIVFGFQTVNVHSDADAGLLSFLDGDEFKKGLTLVTGALPVLGQVSEIALSLTKWLAGQSKNVKVQEFRQGLDLGGSQSGGGLVQGSYVVVQIPLEFEPEWDWSQWRIDPTLLRLVQVEDASVPLDFNHLILGVHEMA